MRGENRRFALKEHDKHGTIQAIENFQYLDLWIFKVIDAFMRALVFLLFQIGIQILFILLFAVIMKKLVMFDFIKEIISIVLDLFNYAKGISKN